MTTIDPDNQLLTFINTLTVAPEHQQKLVDILVNASENLYPKLAGFISANVHKSLDGTRVINYGQIRSREEFEAMLANPEVKAVTEEVKKIATPDPHLYGVVFSKAID